VEVKFKLKVLPNIILAIMLVGVLFPIGWMILLAFTPTEFLFHSIIPPKFTLSNLIKVFSDTEIFSTYRNSWIISGGVVLLTLFIGIPAAYGLSRYHFRLRFCCMVAIIVTQMLPVTLLATAYFRIVSSLGLYNSILVLIVIDGTEALPFAILLLKSTFDTLPKEIEESALIDGCSRMSALIKVTLPVARSGIFAASFFSFLAAWIEFLYGLTLTADATARPITVEIADRLGHYVIHWGELMAMGTASSIPVIVMFFLFQNIFLKGFTSGALKE